MWKTLAIVSMTGVGVVPGWLEDGQLVVYVFVDIRDRDLGGYVAEARKAVAEAVPMPASSSMERI